MINYLNFVLFHTDVWMEIEPQTTTAVENKSSVSPQTTTSQKYACDIESLTKRFGNLSKGRHISISLQEILDIIPRHRRRVEAYMGLTSYLKKKLDVTLTIRSKRSYEKEN